MIYFIQATDGGPIKIGHSVNVAARLRTLQSGIRRSGRKLRVLGVMDGGADDERSVHDVFSMIRFHPEEVRETFPRCHIYLTCLSEWFAPDDNLIEYIETFSRPWADVVRGGGWGRYSAP